MAFEIDAATHRRIEEIAKARGMSATEVVRAAVENFDSSEGGAGWLDRAEAFGLIGCSDSGPTDLSTDKKHFEGFGDD